MSSESPQAERWLEAHPEFVAFAIHFGRLSSREHRDRLACGAIAERCLKRYSRELNVAKLAEYLTQVNETPTSRESLNDYRSAYRMYRLWRRKCGGPPPHLDITKLAHAYRSGPAHFTDDDKVTLCERTAQRGITRSQMPYEALRISRERTQAGLRYEITPKIRRVEQIDGLDLLRECVAESVDVIILDWMYKPLVQRTDKAQPRVHVPSDPMQHLIECLTAARAALSRHGIIALFTDHRSDPDEQLYRALRASGLRRVDQYIHQRMAGNFSQAVGSVYASAHEPIDIYRRSDVDAFPNRLVYERSVSPKWHNRNHRTASEPAVHPCEKPVELMMALIRPITVNGLVVDPFAGSGSAGVAAVQLGCGFKGAELVGEYVEIANRRIALAVDREQETEAAINEALDGANAEQRAAIEQYLDQAGIELKNTGNAA